MKILLVYFYISLNFLLSFTPLPGEVLPFLAISVPSIDLRGFIEKMIFYLGEYG
jgi:hypothetical protein